MGTRTLKIALLVIVACLVLSSLAWAKLAPVPPSGATAVDDSQAAVYYYDDPRFEAWITLGADQGLAPSAQVAFYRDGVEVARGEVITVRGADAIVKPARDTAGGTIRPGDTVRVVENGSRGDVNKALLKKRAWEGFLTITLTAGLALLIAIGG